MTKNNAKASSLVSELLQLLFVLGVGFGCGYYVAKEGIIDKQLQAIFPTSTTTSQPVAVASPVIKPSAVEGTVVEAKPKVAMPNKYEILIDGKLGDKVVGDFSIFYGGNEPTRIEKIEGLIPYKASFTATGEQNIHVVGLVLAGTSQQKITIFKNGIECNPTEVGSGTSVNTRTCLATK